jgi:hypothetical protein
VAETYVFKQAAFKHGVAEADIRNAFERPIFDHALPDEERKNLLVGFDSNGNLLEILYNVLDDNRINVFHAMKCRKAYHALVGLQEKP